MIIRTTRYLALLGVMLVLGQPAAFAQHVEAQALGDGMELLRVRPNFYVLIGAGANVGIQVGANGIVVVDAGDVSHADRLVAELKKLWPEPIRYVINTGADPDHVGGNEKLAKAGRNISKLGKGPSDTKESWASIVAAEAVLVRMSAAPAQGKGKAEYSENSWPTEAFMQPRRYMYLNDEGIETLQQPSAHADGDSIVFFRRSDVVMAGDIIDTRRFPVIDVARGGSINGEIAALNRIIELAIPSVPLVSEPGGTVVVPGHGRLLHQLDVVEYRDMVTIVRDRVQDLMKQGKSLAEVKAANPTQGYTRRYGSDKGSWTTDMFVEAVFKTLAADTPQQR